MANDNTGLSFNEWAVLLGVLTMVTLFVVPKLLKERKIINAQKRHTQRVNSSGDVNTENALSKTVTEASPDSIGYPQPSTKGQKNLEPTDDMVKTYYVVQKEDVPLNYERKPVGACPASKPMSRDLPLANVPMALVASGTTHLG